MRKPENILRILIGVLSGAVLVATWTLIQDNRIAQISASVFLGWALWGLGTGTVRVRGREFFIEDAPYRFCILMGMFLTIGLAIAGPFFAW